MKKLDNKGMTLVEMVLAIVILGMAGVLLTESFVSSMNIINKATLYKNASATISSSIEVDKVQASKDSKVEAELSHSSSTPIVVKLGESSSVTVSGQYVTCSDVGGSTKLKYHEYLPSNYGYEVPATLNSGEGE